MKAFTKKEFKKACFKEIEKMNDEEVETVRKGLYILFDKLEINGKTLEVGNLNSNSIFLLDITCKASMEVEKRVKKDEMQD